MNKRDKIYRQKLGGVYDVRRAQSRAFRVGGLLLVLAALGIIGKGHAGDIRPAALPAIPVCTLSAGSGTLDFGSRSRGQLQSVPGGMTPGERVMQVSVTCSLAREVKLRVDGPARGGAFSWGGEDSTLRVRVRQARLDGAAVQLQKLSAGGSPVGESQEALDLMPGNGLLAVHGGVPVQGKRLEVMLEVEPVLGERDSHPVQRAYPEALLHFALIN